VKTRLKENAVLHSVIVPMVLSNPVFLEGVETDIPVEIKEIIVSYL